MLIKHNKRKRIVITIVVLLLSLGVLITLFLLWNRSTSTTIVPSVETTSKEPSAQSDFNQGGEREAIVSEKTEGYVTDTNGQISPTSNQENKLTSPGGLITVYSPLSNALLSTGDNIIGAASVDRVSFRLIDDVSGVISQGSLAVINGRFSGTFSFETKGKEGRLDLFTANTNGIETNVIEIPVRFK